MPNPDQALQNPPPEDLFRSPVWDAMVENYLTGYPIVFDRDVEVGLPPVTEDQTQVPITVDARRLGVIDEMVVLGDLNPFPLTFKMRPGKAPAYVAFRMRIEQGTVIRAAVRKDGQWHLGGRYLDAAGGGCSVPPVTESHVDWDHLGQMRARVWRESPDLLRLRLRIVHPMDTGLHKEPAFFIDDLKIADASGALLAEMDVREPIASNPTLTLLLNDPKAGDHLAIAVRDTDGGRYKANVPIGRAITTTIREGRL